MQESFFRRAIRVEFTWGSRSLHALVGISIHMKRILITTIGLAAIHLVLAIGTLMVALAVSLPAFDNPDYQPSFAGRAIDWVADLLSQPGASIWTPWMSRHLPDSLEWGVFLGNSLLWGFALALVIRALGSIGSHGKRSIQFSK